MRRALAPLLAVAALAALPAASDGATCRSTLLWHAARYEHVRVRGHLAPGRVLGTGGLALCRGRSVEPGIRRMIPAVLLRVEVRAVPGVRRRVALAVRGATRARLYVSRVTPTAAERAVLARLRDG
jgi:hypothetical protein